MPRQLYIALIMLSLIWGGSFFFIKNLLNDFGPWTIAFLRSAFGLLLIMAVMLVTREPLGLRKVKWLTAFIVAMVNMAVPWTLIGFSETRLASNVASVMNATTPIWTLLVGLLFFGTVVRGMQWLGMGIAMVGLVILLGITPGSLTTVDPLGFAGMLSATLCYAVGSQLSKRFLSGLSMFQLSFATLLGAVIGSGVLAVLTEDMNLGSVLKPANLGGLIGLGVFGSGVAYILFNYMILKGSPEFATSVTYLVPATAMIWGYTLLDEPVGWNLIAGLVLILGGVFVAGKAFRRKAASRA
ncbi:EamA family transporter [Paenibacillus sp. JX-17]|uniref:EamA family transporter n=1 Tax=Paenibacillus lacisoli TaxID=3064525 RepID=A0ABT9CBY1_9BACL|nr:EamA family transporter [Paenibacillus sp. JX-17]MDO7906764.1 EamA family transporter [Paenibacillus sp. JX-17]